VSYRWAQELPRGKEWIATMKAISRSLIPKMYRPQFSLMKDDSAEGKVLKDK